MSESVVRYRVQRLEQADILQVVGIANPLRIGFDLMALVGVQARRRHGERGAPSDLGAARAELRRRHAGRFDLFVEVICRDTAHFHTFLTEQLTRIDGVERCESFLVLDIKKLAYGWGVGRNGAEERLSTRSSSSRRAPTARPTTASGSATSCAARPPRGLRDRGVVRRDARGEGFEERLMRLGPPPEAEEEPGQFWKDFIGETAPVFRRPTIEQLEGFIAPTLQALFDGARYVDERLREIFDELQPDVVVEDNVVAFPAIPASGRPWVRIVSCNPAEMQGRRPAAGRSPATRSTTATGWDAFRAEYRAHPRASCTPTSTRSAGERGAPPLPEREFMHESPVAQPLRLSRRARLPARAAARADLAQPAGVACGRPTTPWSCPPRGRGDGRWSTSASARSARPTSS